MSFEQNLARPCSPDPPSTLKRDWILPWPVAPGIYNRLSQQREYHMYTTCGATKTETMENGLMTIVHG